MSSTVNYIVELCISVFVAAYLLPPAIAAIVNATSYGDANPAVITIATVLFPILVVVAIALLLMPDEIKSKVHLK